MIELALPSGSLETALTAFRNGADAVYFGLKEFSARKGAVNFSMEDLSRIRRYSIENGKKIYLTINTLIDDGTVDQMLKTLDQVAFYGNDGIIIQDLGIARIIKDHYPSLALHGSTQLAVHTTEGVKQLQDLGFERVVLSRELNLKEIEKIRHDCPDIEIKAFIHGALCYGFSGLCSASYLKCGRSANGGECAQICRSWFNEDNTGRKGYFFSMEDMRAGQELLELDRIGIESAKIEGRLKSPEYVAAVARYYRGILDRGYATDTEQQDICTTFARKQGPGYLDYRKDRPSLLSGDYPGHMGLECGPVIKQTGAYATVETQIPIESHDGLQYFTQDRFGLPQSHKLSADVVRSDRHSVTLRVDPKETLGGRTLYKISDSTKREKTPSTSIAPYRKPADITVTLTDTAISATALGKTVTRELTLQPAKNPIDPSQTVGRHFSESGDSLYTLGKLSFTNESTIPNPFLPPSVMKDFRRQFYTELDSVRPQTPCVPEPQRTVANTLVLPDRNLLAKDLPWSLDPTVIGDRTYFTLPPVTFDEQALFDKALRTFQSAAAEGAKVTVGLNNIAQVRLAKAHPEFDYFADVFLYLSNRYTALELSQQVPSLVGGYLWFERDAKSGTWPFEPTIVKGFEMPSFISRTCYRHDSRGESCKGCRMNWDYRISQSPDTFVVKVRNCLTVVQRLK